MFSRELKNHAWRFENGKLEIHDKKAKTTIVLDKVRFVSLARFILSCLDKMRIEAIRGLREKIREIKAKRKK